MNKPVLPTLKDVSRHARVSTATISRCLNSPDRVAESTRNRVLKAVESLGYSPNFGAKALASKRTNTIGAIIPTMDNAIFARGLQAFQEQLTLQGATLLVTSSYYDQSIEEQQIRSMIAHGADGLLLIGKLRSKKIYHFLEQRDIPFVIAWSVGTHVNSSFVGFDNSAPSSELAERAIALGHRRFAYISADQSNNDRARDRIKGVKRALHENGIDAVKMPIIVAPYSIAEAGEAFKQLMMQHPQTTIVMCGNDVQAVGAIKMARSLNLRIPEDVSITGFDDLEIATVVEPGVTTVHVPHHEMGKTAADILLAQMNDPSTYKRITLPTYVVERQSLDTCK